MALIVAEVFVFTALVTTEKVADLAPLAMVTKVGRVAALEEELNATADPAAPAFLESVTVPVKLAPPATVVGESVSFVTV